MKKITKNIQRLSLLKLITFTSILLCLGFILSSNTTDENNNKEVRYQVIHLNNFRQLWNNVGLRNLLVLYQMEVIFV